MRWSFLGLGALFSLLLIGGFEWSFQHGLFFVSPCVRLTTDDIAYAVKTATLPKHHNTPVTILLTTPPSGRNKASIDATTSPMTLTRINERDADKARHTTRPATPPPDVASRTVLTIPANYPSPSGDGSDEWDSPSDSSDDDGTGKLATPRHQPLLPSIGRCTSCRGVTFITAVSNVGIQSVANLVGSMHRFVGECPLIIYDMGLNTGYRRDMAQWRHVHIRDSPIHPFHALSYATLRPWLIRDAMALVEESKKVQPLAEGCTMFTKKIVYVDPDLEFARSDIDGIVAQIESRGYYYHTRDVRGCGLAVQGYEKGSLQLQSLLSSLPKVACGHKESCVAKLSAQKPPSADAICDDKVASEPFLLARPTTAVKPWLPFVRKSRPFAIVMPFAHAQVDTIVAAFEYWSEYLPCTDPDSMGAHDYNQHSSTPLILPDLYLFNSQHLPATSKQLLTRAFFTDERVWRCFRSLRFVDADHDPAEDQQPMGSNKQWLAVLHSPLFTEMRKSHDYMLWMEPDTQPIRANWLWSIHHATANDPVPYWGKGDCWEGSISDTERLEQRMHIGASAIWSLAPEFASFTRGVYQKPNELPFDAEIFHFLNNNYAVMRDTLHMFRFTKMIINMWQVQWHPAQLRSWFPDAALVHGSLRVSSPVASIHGAAPVVTAEDAAAAAARAKPKFTAEAGSRYAYKTRMSTSKMTPTHPPSFNHSGHAITLIAEKPFNAVAVAIPSVPPSSFILEPSSSSSMSSSVPAIVPSAIPASVAPVVVVDEVAVLPVSTSSVPTMVPAVPTSDAPSTHHHHHREQWPSHTQQHAEPMTSVTPVVPSTPTTSSAAVATATASIIVPVPQVVAASSVPLPARAAAAASAAGADDVLMSTSSSAMVPVVPTSHAPSRLPPLRHHHHDHHQADVMATTDASVTTVVVPSTAPAVFSSIDMTTTIVLPAAPLLPPPATSSTTTDVLLVSAAPPAAAAAAAISVAPSAAAVVADSHVGDPFRVGGGQTHSSAPVVAEIDGGNSHDNNHDKVDDVDDRYIVRPSESLAVAAEAPTSASAVAAISALGSDTVAVGETVVESPLPQPHHDDDQSARVTVPPKLMQTGGREIPIWTAPHPARRPPPPAVATSPRAVYTTQQKRMPSLPAAAPRAHGQRT